jgi:hypothetical protein
VQLAVDRPEVADLVAEIATAVSRRAVEVSEDVGKLILREIPQLDDKPLVALLASSVDAPSPAAATTSNSRCKPATGSARPSSGQRREADRREPAKTPSRARGRPELAARGPRSRNMTLADEQIGRLSASSPECARIRE